ncbi:GNAT family N-acetyltransferase [Paenibacillus sp. CMAA1364]
MIRAAKKEDVTYVSRLMYDALHDIAHQLTGQDLEQDTLDTLDQFFVQETGRLSYRQMLVKELNGAVVGLIISYAGADSNTLDQPILDYLRILKNDTSIMLDKETDEGEYYIDTLSVSPDYSRQGIGAELMLAAEAEAVKKQIPLMSLLVLTENVGAYTLYQRSGYVTDKELIVNGRLYHHMVKPIVVER